MAGLPSRSALLRRLDAQSKKGSVTATRALLEELRRDADEDTEPKSRLDALDNVTPLRAATRKAR